MVICAKTAELIKMPFGLLAQMGPRNRVRWRSTVAKGCCYSNQFVFLYMGVHWRHLANTTEPSVCSGNAALCQITLTTCFICSVKFALCCPFCHTIFSVVGAKFCCLCYSHLCAEKGR